jgi:MFS family permease
MGLLGPFAGKLLDTIGLKPLAIFGIAVMTYATSLIAAVTIGIIINAIPNERST